MNSDGELFEFWWRRNKHVGGIVVYDLVTYESASQAGGVVISASTRGVSVEVRHFMIDDEAPSPDWWMTPHSMAIYQCAVEQCRHLRSKLAPRSHSHDPWFVLNDPEKETI